MRLRAALAGLALALAGVAAGAQPAADVRQVGNAIRFDGRIDQPAVDEFLRLLRDPAIRRLQIRSPGGLVAPALQMADAVHERGMDLEVEGACFSSCANYIFPAARNKRLSGPFAIGWHGNMTHVLYRHQMGLEHWTAGQLAEARRLARLEAAFYRRVGMDGYAAWFGKLPPYSVDAFYTLGLADMARFGIAGVSIRDPRGAAAQDVRMVAVDWTQLDANRPAVSLQDP